MKRLLIVLLALVLLLGSACAEHQLAYEEITRFGDYIRQLADGDYMDICQVPQETQRLVRSWAAGIQGKPRMVVRLHAENLAYMVSTRSVFMQEPDMVRYEAESSVLIELWWTLCSIAAGESTVAGVTYEQMMQANAAITPVMICADADAEDGYGMYLVFYDAGKPLVIISSCENGAVNLQGMFLPSEKLMNCRNYGQVSLYMMMNGLTLTCQEIREQ